MDKKPDKKSTEVQEHRQIKVNTGKVSYDIVDEVGELLGTVRVNLADFGLWARAERFVENLNALEEPEEVTVDWFEETAKYIEDQFDQLFAGHVSEGLFGITYPFVMLENGDFYFEECAYQLVGLIEESLGTRMETKLNKLEKTKTVRKATSKYHK